MFSIGFLQESLKEKFERLVVNNPAPNKISKDYYSNVVEKFSNMSLQELHEKVKEIGQDI